MKEVNRKLSVISRVVVHPKYRTIGLGVKLIRETLPMAGTPFIEMPAVMAKHNPFAEKAGMREITEQPPAKEAMRIGAALQTLGFNLELLGSKDYVLRKLQDVEPDRLTSIRQAFIKFNHVRFKKVFSTDLPFGQSTDYVKRIERADLQTLAGLIRVCGFLLQSKVYLFWSRVPACT